MLRGNSVLSFFVSWEQRKLDDIVDRYDNLRIPVAANLRIKGNTPYYGANGIQDHVKGYTHKGEFILVAEDGANDLKNYPVQYVNGYIWANNHVHVLQAKKEKANNKFIKYAISQTNIESLLVGGGRAKLNANIMMEIELKMPDNLQEQSSIGNIISKIDNLITLHQSKYDKLVNVKKALLEKMFPKDGKNVPEIRFKGFTDTWEQRKLDDIVDRYDNLRIPVAANLRIKGNTPYYGANGIQDHVKGYTHKGEFILVAEDGANDLKNYPVQYVNGYIWANNHVHVLQAKKEKANNKFIKYAISQTNIESLLVGGGRAKLNANIMMEIELKMPDNLQEQSSIGNIISKIDNLITLHQHKCFLKFDNNINIELLGNSVSLRITSMSVMKEQE